MAALRSAFSQLRDILSMAHLITESNIKAFVTPTVLAGMLAVGSGGVTTDIPTWLDVATALPKVALYIWLWDLYFDCSNQKDPGSIEEDRLNKPWRAIPSGRLSVEAAERWYVCSAIIMPAAAALWLGGLPEAIAFMLETWAYDRLGGGSTWWGRCIINPLFFSTGQLGAIRVAAGTWTTVNQVGFEWCALRKITSPSSLSSFSFPRSLVPSPCLARCLRGVWEKHLVKQKSCVFFLSSRFPRPASHGPAPAPIHFRTHPRTPPEPAPCGCHVFTNSDGF